MPGAGDESELVFVYGTLRRGGSNAFRMDGADFRGPARVEGELHAITWYPGLALKPGGGWVIGELYKVGSEQLRALDEFEGLSAGEVEGSEYRRVKVPVQLHETAEQEMVSAWAYEWKGPVDESKRVVSGDWLDMMQPRPMPVFTWVALLATASIFVTFYVGIRGLIAGRDWHLALIGAVFLGSPIIGITAVLIGNRRRERMNRLRQLSFGICLVFGLIAAAGWLIVIV
jgi:gamma-glutamylcyclotransferase (GGCT)/AIG2-like uncharacterized protein YtfP